MLMRKSTPAAKTGRMSAMVVGVLVYAGAHASPAAGVDSMDALPPGAPLYGYIRAARSGATVAAKPTANFDVMNRGVAGSAPGLSVAVDTSLSDLVARLRRAFGSDLGLSSTRAQQDEREVLLTNTDALVRTKVRLAQGKEWHSFLYADMGAADSALRWQSAAGIRGGHGVDLLGGWRHVTYHFSPGKGFDSLEFNGPFLAATLAW